MSPIYFLVIFSYIITIKQTSAKSSPVLIYGLKLPLRDVFPTMKTDEFKEIMKQYVDKFAFFVSLEENFQARQLSCTAVTGKGCYSDFPESGEYTFYGSVDRPLDALQELFSKSVLTEVDNKGKLQKTEICEEGYNNKLNILHTTDSSISNLSLLTLRTNVMLDVSEKLKNCDLSPLFLFTANVADDIQYKANEKDDDKKVKSWLLVKSFSTTLVDDGIIIDVATKAHGEFQNTNAELKNITFGITKRPMKYTQVNVTLDNEEYLGSKLNWGKVFDWDAPQLIFKRPNKTLRINKLKLERFSGLEKFLKLDYNGDDWYTCNLVTPGILMGLFVLSIFVIFLYWGLTMLLDIQANDRFDGPKMQMLQFANIEN